MKRALLMISLALAGCGKTFYTSVNGENDIIGVCIPDTSVEVKAVSHINGETVNVSQPSKIIHTYTLASTNSYFGIVHINETMAGTIEVQPMTNSVESISK